MDQRYYDKLYDTQLVVGGLRNNFRERCGLAPLPQEAAVPLWELCALFGLCYSLQNQVGGSLLLDRLPWFSGQAQRYLHENEPLPDHVIYTWVDLTQRDIVKAPPRSWLDHFCAVSSGDPVHATHNKLLSYALKQKVRPQPSS